MKIVLDKEAKEALDYICDAALKSRGLDAHVIIRGIEGSMVMAENIDIKKMVESPPGARDPGKDDKDEKKP